jgi:hypothetical protein
MRQSALAPVCAPRGVVYFGELFVGARLRRALP